jgi:hypothetical protein
VFFLELICRSRIIGRLIGLVATVLILLLPGMAAADGETYTWTDAQHGSIQASGGPYASTADFIKQPDASYTANDLVLTCTSGTTATFTGTSKLAVANGGGQYQIDNSALTQPVDCIAQKFSSQFTVAAISATTNSASTNPNGTCDQGSVSWIMCPVIDNISNTIAKLAKDVLVPLLQVNHISASSTPTLYQAWQHIRDFADILFILIFMTIIFATITEQDVGALSRYHIKTIWPRLIIAAILVQFSFFISGLIIDVGNVLGTGIQALIFGITGPSATANPTNIIENLVTGGVAVVAGSAGALGATALFLSSWTVAFPIILSLLISLLAGFMTLAARFLIIAILVVLSPLAMAAWVLPNTERMFSSWGKMLTRLVMMYPIIIGVITLAGIVDQILPYGSSTTSSGVASVAVAILKPLIVIAAFAAVPLSFRYAGRSMGAVSGFISDTGKKGRGAVRDSAMGQRGKEERQRRQASFMNRAMNSRSITGLQGRGVLGRAGAGILTTGAGLAMLNAPRDKAGLERLNSRLTREATKQLEEMEEATVPNLHKVHGAFSEPDLAKRIQNRKDLKKAAPNLYQLTTTLSGQAAVARRLGDLGLSTSETVRDYAYAPKGGNFFRASNTPQAAYSTVLKQIGKEGAKKPGVTGRITEAKSDYALKDAAGTEIAKIRREIGDLDLNGVGGTIGRVTGKTFGDDHSVENFKVMSTRGDSNTALDRAALEMADLYAQRLDRNELTKAMDITNPHKGTNLSGRVEWMKNIQLNHDIFETKNPEILRISTANLAADQDLTNVLLKEMKVDSNPGIQALSATGRANVVRDWMHGHTYDPWHPSYEVGGKIAP